MFVQPKYAVIVFLFWALLVTPLDADLVGEAMGPPAIMTMHDMETMTTDSGEIGGWSIVHPGLEYAPGTGPWEKMLFDLPSMASPAPPHYIHEKIVVGGGPDWTDWHQIISDPDWAFVTSGTMAPMFTITRPEMDPTGPTAMMVMPDAIWIDFDPAPPGSTIEIWKYVEFTGSMGPPRYPITMIQHPTVPEPSAFLLLGLVTGLAYAGHKLKQRRSRRTSV